MREWVATNGDFGPSFSKAMDEGSDVAPGGDVGAIAAASSVMLGAMILLCGQILSDSARRSQRTVEEVLADVAAQVDSN